MKTINNKYYSIVKTGIDTFKLTIKKSKKEIDFKRDVNFISEIQKSNALGKIEFIKVLKEQGLTKSDLIDRKEEIDKKGKITIKYDETNFRYLEKEFVNQAAGFKMLELMEKILGQKAESLLEEMDIPIEEQENVGGEFGNDFKTCMIEMQEETPRTIARSTAKN